VNRCSKCSEEQIGKASESIAEAIELPKMGTIQTVMGIDSGASHVHGTQRSAELPAEQRLSVPGRGRVLSSIAESYGAPVRQAVNTVAAGFKRHADVLPVEITNFRSVGPRSVIVARSGAEMAAWHLCTQWLLGVALGSLAETATLIQAAEWFADRAPHSLAMAASRFGSRYHTDALIHLRSIAEPKAIAELLPYVLDPHGPGSRLSPQSFDRMVRLYKVCGEAEIELCEAAMAVRTIEPGQQK
jgi:hypothetical protein